MVPRRMSSLKPFRQTGDTIVEVLFALAVMGFVLAISYSMANRSLLATRRTQERAEAIKFTETQIERIKAKAAVGFSFPTNRIFCLDKQLNVKNIGSITTLPTAANPQFALYEAPGALCHYDGNNQPSFYHYAIDYDPHPTGPYNEDFFTILTRWERAGGGGYDELTMYYKVHK